jgi:transglutaminase-like putative cysteine protease
VVRIHAERVEHSLRFWVRAVLDRVRADGPVRLPAHALTDPRLLRSTRLTIPDRHIRDLAGGLGSVHVAPLELASRICHRVHAAITYQHGVTSITTTAAEALDGVLLRRARSPDHQPIDTPSQIPGPSGTRSA